MADIPTPPAPGEMTVPPLFGWEQIALALVLLLALVVLAAVVAAARGSRGARPEWQTWLDARSRRTDDDAQDPAEEPAR